MYQAAVSLTDGKELQEPYKMRDFSRQEGVGTRAPYWLQSRLVMARLLSFRGIAGVYETAHPTSAGPGIPD